MLVLQQNGALRPDLRRDRFGEGAQPAYAMVDAANAEGLDHTAHADIADGIDQNILDDIVWDQLLQRIKKGEFDVLFARPPSSMFTLNFRNPQRPGRYGVKATAAKAW